MTVEPAQAGMGTKNIHFNLTDPTVYSYCNVVLYGDPIYQHNLPKIYYGMTRMFKGNYPLWCNIVQWMQAGVALNALIYFTIEEDRLKIQGHPKGVFHQYWADSTLIPKNTPLQFVFEIDQGDYGANNGTFKMWMNGELKADLIGLDLYDAAPAWGKEMTFHLGLYGPNPNVESWANYIRVADTYEDAIPTPTPPIDLATIGAIILGISDAGLLAWGLAHLAGLV